jgi:hypothetical protein
MTSRIGRILNDAERNARMAGETVMPAQDELLRSAFVISDRHVLTAWHCVAEFLTQQSDAWFRLRIDAPGSRRYVYLPVRVTNYDTALDVAALALDPQRLAAGDLTRAEAMSILSDATIPLQTDVYINDTALVLGFPQSGVGADSDTNHATVVDTALPLGEVTGLKLTGTAFGAVSPVDPHGISGGPVLRATANAGNQPHPAVAIIRAIPRGIIPAAASGASLIATRIADLTESLPEVAMAIAAASPVTVRASDHTVQHNVLAMSRECSAALRESLVIFEDDKLGKLTGWAHFFQETHGRPRPTAIGTAYGLKLALALGEKDGRLSLADLAETLWKLQRDGGWGARSSRGISRPEVGALIVGALASAGADAGRLAEATGRIKDRLTHDADPDGMERTYVVSAAMRGLLRAAPRSTELVRLRGILLEGTMQDPDHDNLLCWGSRLSPEGSRPQLPSVAHTAMAVVSLTRTDQIFGTTGASRSALDQALRWLVSRHLLENQIEQIRRVEENDSMTVAHFTAAWVARALLTVPAADIPGADALLYEAVQKVWGSYSEGFWEWEDRDRPLWMAYQGACVMRDYAMRSWAPA